MRCAAGPRRLCVCGAAQTRSLELAAEHLGHWICRERCSALAVPTFLLVVWWACSCRCLRRAEACWI